MTNTTSALTGSQSDARKTLSNQLVWSYLWHRRITGALGILLPWVLLGFAVILGADPLPESLSAHFHSVTGPIFVATWCVVGAFLLSYHGYHWADYVVTSAGGVGAIGLSLCPTAGTQVQSVCPAGPIHGIFVALFFISMIVLVFCIFTRSRAVTRMDPARTTRLNLVRWFGFLWYLTPKTQEEGQARPVWKQVRDFIYMFAGLVTAICGLLMISDSQSLGAMSVFWFETAAISAFGVAWFVKGVAYREEVDQEEEQES